VPEYGDMLPEWVEIVSVTDKRKQPFLEIQSVFIYPQNF
jgi:hypothetical protein